jgi:hypothetical protein
LVVGGAGERRSRQILNTARLGSRQGLLATMLRWRTAEHVLKHKLALLTHICGAWLHPLA